MRIIFAFLLLVSPAVAAEIRTQHDVAYAEPKRVSTKPWRQRIGDGDGFTSDYRDVGR